MRARQGVEKFADAYDELPAALTDKAHALADTPKLAHGRRWKRAVTPGA